MKDMQNEMAEITKSYEGLKKLRNKAAKKSKAKAGEEMSSVGTAGTSYPDNNYFRRVWL
jgi:hypothetical protein